MSTLTNSYPGFEAAGRLEVLVRNEADLAASHQYLQSIAGIAAILPASPWGHIVPSVPLPADVTSSRFESDIHAHVVSFWDEIPIFSDWRLLDTELSFSRSEGRADLYACHRTRNDEHLVVELKRGGDDRYVVGQLLEYMATISLERQVATSRMKGIILCPPPSERLKLMVSRVDGVQLVPLDRANVPR
jgi:hypothetical protein